MKVVQEEEEEEEDEKKEDRLEDEKLFRKLIGLMEKEKLKEYKFANNF